MKKLLIITAVILISLAANAQSTVQNPPKKAKVKYSIFWGLFKSEGYKKDSKKYNLPEYKAEFYDIITDTTKYEVKSFLWGAVKWTEKKKNTSSLK
jgi:hypothetical protein